MALLLVVLASLAALYDGKILVWDIAGADLRAGSGSWLAVAVAVIVTAAFVSLPLVLGLRLARAGRTRAASLVCVASLVMSALGFAVLASAFTP